MPPNGYHWWYLDALSDDGLNGLTIIGFVGSVFSPYYARARARGITAAENHCAINVALYGSKRRWAMTERGARHVSRDEASLAVGPSSMRWEKDELLISIKETGMPLPLALRGNVRLKAANFCNRPVMLDDLGRHFWQAVAPQARVTVEFESPQLSWEGIGYHDMNWGNEPLEKGFKNWTWARAHMPNGMQVLYDVERRDGTRQSFGCSFKDGITKPRSLPPTHELPKGFWGMARSIPSENPPRLISTLEDAPFYTRNLVELTLDGAPCMAFHESLSLDRFIHPVVQLMLPFRMPRIG